MTIITYDWSAIKGLEKTNPLSKAQKDYLDTITAYEYDCGSYNIAGESIYHSDLDSREAERAMRKLIGLAFELTAKELPSNIAYQAEAKTCDEGEYLGTAITVTIIANDTAHQAHFDEDDPFAEIPTWAAHIGLASTPQKTAPKKTASKKSTPKKSTPKKTASKKSTPKKSTPKKTASKKSTPKKTASKKSSNATLQHILRNKCEMMGIRWTKSMTVNQLRNVISQAQ